MRTKKTAVAAHILIMTQKYDFCYSRYMYTSHGNKYQVTIDGKTFQVDSNQEENLIRWLRVIPGMVKNIL